MSEPTVPASKRCIGCDEEKPLEDFGRDKRKRDGCTSRCKPCSAEYNRQWYAAHREEQQERGRRARADNNEAYLERDRLRREANREVIRERGRLWARKNSEQGIERQRQYSANLQAQVLAHYGTECACCGGTDRLTVDHIAGDGREHREELFGNNKAAGRQFYRWLIRNDFPPGYQTLCMPCNISKGRGERCRIAHAVAEAS